MVRLLLTTALLSLLAPRAAFGVHESGGRWEVVGFSLVGSVLVRQVDVQHGIVGYEVRATESGEPLLVRVLGADDDAASVEGALRAEHGIVAPGFVGPQCPMTGAALLIVAGPVGRDSAFDYHVLLADGLGNQGLAPIEVANECHRETGAQGDLTVRWSPDGRAAVVAGHVSVEAPCGQPTAHPVLRFARPRAPLPPSALPVLAAMLLERAQQLERARAAEAAVVARQAVALAPTHARARLTLSRLRALSGNPGGSLSALWSLVQLEGGAGIPLVEQALSSPWASDLNRRAAFAALQWVVQEHRGAASPPPSPPEP